jgi:hypothetical protein
MSDSVVTSPFQEERAELETVAEWLGRSPRLQKLLRFIGDRYFNGEHDQLKEYNIAVDLFGRSAGRFNPNNDAIARVEAHRLRKRLKEYYETDGKEHAVRIILPAGSYVPVFLRHATVEKTVVAPPSPRPPEPLLPKPPDAPAKRPRYGRLIWLLVAGAAVLGVVLYLLQAAHKSQPAAVVADGGGARAVAPSMASAVVPLRMMAGYSGPARLDSSGNEWQPDRYYEGGRPFVRQTVTTLRTNRPMLFQQWRSGEFSYNIPLSPGTYELHLYFVDSGDSGQVDTDDFRTFSVFINGQLALTNFEIESDALGTDIADERVFKDVHPGPDGKLHLVFQGEKSIPLLNAIEVLPGIPGQQRPVRIAMLSTPFTDHAGQFWGPDDYYAGGRVSVALHPISGTSDPNLFSKERYGHFTYAIPVDRHGKYTLILHFAEFYFGPDAPGGGGIGNRVFNVMCNGVLLLDHFDIYKEAGALHAFSKTLHHIEPTAQGKLNLTFEPVVNNATVSGIEVLDESHE